MATIQLTKGYVATVDDADYEELSKHMWQANITPNGVYAKRTIYAGGKGRIVLMHRQIMGLSDYRRIPDPSTALRGGSQRLRFAADSASDGRVVDHINGDTLDNTRINLRVGDRKLNASNTWKHREKAMMQEISRLQALVGAA